MGGGAEINATEIAAMANQRVASLARELLPKARLANGGKYLECGSIDGEPGQSLKVNLKGNIGLWTDFSAPDGSPERGGDMLNLVALVKFGGIGTASKAKAIMWLKSYLGLDHLDPGRIAEVRRQAKATEEKLSREAEAAAAAKSRSAWYLWKFAAPLPRSPAEAYLAGRGLDLRSLGHAPGVLRYRPDVWCPVRSTHGNRRKFPAMVAGVIDLAGNHVGTHRTYLDIDGWDFAERRGTVKIVKVQDPKGRWKSHKQSLGEYAGGHVPLWKGEHKQTLREIPEGTPVYVSEGIEDGLSIAMAFPERRVVAGVALANMGGMEFPPQVGPIVFVGQNDPANSKAAEALERAIERQQQAGRTVQTIFPPPEFKDFNDLLCGKRKDGTDVH